MLLRHGDARRRYLQQHQHYVGAVPTMLFSYGRSDSAGEIEVDIKVSGMVCDGCSGRVAEALQVSKTVFWQHRSMCGCGCCCGLLCHRCSCMRRVLLLLVVRLMSRSICQKWTVTHSGLCCRRADRGSPLL